jgi:radical SAM superfamily enzyme YgiQ (UPF0313 family)
MKFFLLDVYSPRNYRVSKDTNGGFGTGNDYGNSLFNSFLAWIKKHTTDFPPLSLAYTAGVLESQGHSVIAGRNQLPPKDVDIVLLSSSIVEFSAEIEWGKKLREAGYHVGYIGPFAGIESNSYLSAGDFVVMGEPEFFFLSRIEKERLKGKVYSNNDTALDALPFPSWDPFDARKFKYRLYGGGGRFFPMLASRGCPYSCRYYCTYPLQQGSVVRYRSPKNIVDEMEFLKRKYRANTILFRDPIFSISRNRTGAFLDELISRNLQTKFIIETHLSTLDDELIRKFRQAGLITVKVGIEAANQAILRESHRKMIDEDFQREMIRKLEDAGIRVICFYMLGLPHDTWETCLETIQYAKALNTAGAQFSIFTPYPGTPFYEGVKDRISSPRFDDFTQFNLVYKHRTLAHEEIEALKNIAYRDYYLRLSWITKYLKERFLH